MRNSIEYRLWGRSALFSDPLLKVGSKKCSYNVPTYQALKGVTESIYWKPSITWYIDKVRIVNKINSQDVGVKNKDYNSDDINDLKMYSYLRDVEYHVCAHFEFNNQRPDLKDDWNENKHHNIAKRVLKKGGRRDIFLGTRECQGYVEPFDFDNGVSYYEDISEIPLGTMIHGINYPSKKDKRYSLRLWKPVMKKGVIYFPRPEDINVVKELKNYGKEEVRIDNIQDVDVLYKEIFHGE